MPKVSIYRPIFDHLVNGKFELVITEGILQEYTEIVGQKATPQIAQNIGELLVQLKNVETIRIFFRWHLIHIDPDDNKFVDCAVSANATIVTNDKHFRSLSAEPFPKVKVISANEFLDYLAKL